MAFHRRHLPHWYDIGRPVFVTWRLFGSLPGNRYFPEPDLTSGEAFLALDRLLDGARAGPAYLRQPAVADMVVEAMQYNERVLGQYELHAFVVMPNHVHILITPLQPLPSITRSLKGITAKRANQALGLTGQAFWAEESFDHLIRSQREFERVRAYIEQNPVRAGLAAQASDFRWSSAAGATGGSPADQGVRPT